MTIASFIATLCSLAFSILTVAAFAVGMDNVTIGLLACLSVISFGHSVATTKF